jgi:hypothetical protein
VADDPAALLAPIRERAGAAAAMDIDVLAAFNGISVGGVIAASAVDVPRLLKAVEDVLKLADDWEQRAAIHEKRAKDLRDNGGMLVPAAQEARAQTHRADAGDIRAAITAALTEGEGGNG